MWPVEGVEQKCVSGLAHEAPTLQGSISNRESDLSPHPALLELLEFTLRYDVGPARFSPRYLGMEDFLQPSSYYLDYHFKSQALTRVRWNDDDSLVLTKKVEEEKIEICQGSYHEKSLIDTFFPRSLHNGILYVTPLYSMWV